MNVRLMGLFTLRSPLSHIAESISTTSYLVEEPLYQADGSRENVFCYSGNAWRGQLRDLAARYMLDALGIQHLPLDAFHLLFSGGRIGGEQSLDIERARMMRGAIPMLAMWGGGAGNQILPGKMAVNNSYPVCVEALTALPQSLHGMAQQYGSYRDMTVIKSFTRKDDGKDEHLREYAAIDTPRQGAQMTMLGAEEPEKKRGKPREKDGPADQMRMSSELVVAGVRLFNRIDIRDASEVELGCLVSALHQLRQWPYIGGQANRGHGRVDLDYGIVDLETGEAQPFVQIEEETIRLAPVAEAAKAAYDDHLKSLYDEMLSTSKSQITMLLGAGAA